MNHVATKTEDGVVIAAMPAELVPASRWIAPAPQALTPMDMVARAVAQGADIAILEKLMALQERWEANQARKAFDEAMADAKAEIPTITKNRHVGFASKKAGASSTDYRHEDLAEISRTVDAILGRHGISYRFRTTSEINQPISVTCKISHRGGHFEENTLTAGRDESGNKNSIQAIGSTVTYLQRYTLKAALGLAASNDDDGNAAGGSLARGNGAISAEQIDQLVARIDQYGAETTGLLRFFKVARLDDMTSGDFAKAVRMLDQKYKLGAAK
jgi:hypothetical protein